MRLLVTGGAGFIGSNVIQHVIDHPEVERLVNLDCLTYAGHLENLAAVANAQDNAERAIRLFGAAVRLRALILAPLSDSEQSRHQQIVTVARAQLDETTYASAYAEGYAMSPDQAVVFALAL